MEGQGHGNCTGVLGNKVGRGIKLTGAYIYIIFSG